MARPRVRTDRLAPTETDAIRERFGTFRHAQRKLDPDHQMNVDRFRQTVAGHLARPIDVERIRTWWRAFQARDRLPEPVVTDAR